MQASFEYGIYETPHVGELAHKTQEMLNNGWQKAGPIVVYDNENGKMFMQEYVKILPPKDGVFRVDSDAFADKYANMDPKIKDLLEINGIRLVCEDEQLATYFGDERAEGINPSAIINALKNAKHVPIDLDEEQVFNAIEGLL